MRKIITKLFAGMCAVALTFASAVSMNISFAKAESETQIIDMYLIGGQSNAAGYSPIYNNQTETFENVWYAGMTEKVLTGKNHSNGVNSDTTQTFDAFRKKVTGGLGNQNSLIGPEYGMAQKLNDMYAGSDKKAMIFKTAAGGTSLLDNTLELSERYGNWYPRSLWEEGYTPDISGYSENNDPTGLLYQLFVENFKRVYGELVANGYTPVVKGMAWMQGETNLYAEYTKYGDTLKTFIQDIRTDLIDITGDQTLMAMPFVIGKIAPDFAEYQNPCVPMIHAQQERVANEMGNAVATVSTDDLKLVLQNGEYSEGCPDGFHFAFKDAVTLGNRFGEKLIELNGQTLISTNAQNGKLNYLLNNDGTVTFTLSPNEHFKLQSFVVAGQDVTEQVVEGVYTLTGGNHVYAEATFVEKDRLALTYADLGEGAGYLRKAKYWYEGEILSVKIFVNEGYTLGKVTFNGEEMTYNSQTGEYEVLLSAAGEISAVVTKNQTQNSSSNNNTSSSSEGNATGCTSAVGASGGIAGIALSTVLFVKKKRNK